MRFMHAGPLAMVALACMAQSSDSPQIVVALLKREIVQQRLVRARVGLVEAFKIAAPAWSDGESPVATGSPSVPVDLPNR